jgi:hypothetical protein
MQAELLWDGERAVREGVARADGADVRVAYWDGQWSYELPRTVWSSAGEPGWRISFALVGDDEGVGRYHLYYGYPEAQEALSWGKTERAEYALALALGPQESVEWGPTVTWTAHSTATQTLVSPDGRLVFEHPAGALDRDRRVRLRMVPASERRGFGPLPDYEFHVEPVPGGGGLGEGAVVRWDPPIKVSINWAGLPDVGSGPTWAHFRYDAEMSTWEAVPFEFDAETGILWFTTDQP